MAFTVKDYYDLARLLREHPEWREELRHLLLSDELLALPEVVQQLVLTQQRTEKQLLRLEKSVQRLAEKVEALVEGQKHLIERVGSLEEGQKRLIERVDSIEKRVGSLEEGQKRLIDTVGELKGESFERTYERKVSAYFGRRLRQAKPTELYTLEDRLDEVLTLDELDDFFQLDLLVTGKLRHVPESPEILLAVEISSVVDKRDVSRAVRRANLLRKAGYRAVPVVTGKEVTQGASKAAREQNVVLVQDGQVKFWKEAVANWEGIQLEEN